METSGWDGCLERALDTGSDSRWAIDRPHVRRDVTAYLVPSFGSDALLFSVPVLFPRDLYNEISLNPMGADGAVHTLIERIKQHAPHVSALGPLIASGTQFPNRYDAIVEPYTVVHSHEAIGAHLWHPDERNFCSTDGLHLLIRGALPLPPACTPHAIHRVTEVL